MIVKISLNMLHVEHCAEWYISNEIIPMEEHLREVLIHYFIMKKTPAKTYGIFCEANSEHAPSQDTCESWFKRFRNDDFSVKDK